LKDTQSLPATLAAWVGYFKKSHSVESIWQ
jgi:hypothetical protein